MFEKLKVGRKAVTDPDRKNFFIIARGSVQECVTLLDVATRRRWIDEVKHQSFRLELETVATMINGLDNRQR